MYGILDQVMVLFLLVKLTLALPVKDLARVAKHRVHRGRSIGTAGRDACRLHGLSTVTCHQSAILVVICGPSDAAIERVGSVTSA